MSGIEKRQATGWVEAVELDQTRDADGEAGALRLQGYAIVWNTPSERMGNVVETIDPRALDHFGALDSLDVRMQGDHQGLALARTTQGTLRLEKDEVGLRIEADLDARRSDARNLYYAVDRGDVSQMSFGFRVAKGGEELREMPDGTVRAHVTRIERLYEVSPVTFAAYSDTSVAIVRDEDIDAEAEASSGLRCGGCGEERCGCGAASERALGDIDRQRARRDALRGVRRLAG